MNNSQITAVLIVFAFLILSAFVFYMTVSAWSFAILILMIPTIETVIGDKNGRTS